MQGFALRRCAAAAALALLALAPAADAATTTVKVTENDLAPGGDWTRGDTRPDGTGLFEDGPLTAPLGRGSFELRTNLSSAKVQLMTDRHAGTALAAVSGISYSTYRDPASTGFIAAAPAINIRVDTDGNGFADRYAVYEPYQDQGNAAVQTGTWQSWDAYAGGNAKWWLSGGGANPCPQSSPCTFNALRAAYPIAAIQEGTDAFRGSFGVNQGSNNPGIVANADALSLSAGGETTTYDFEPLTGPPTSKDDCKKGGWQQFDNPSFKNQGDCVSYVATGGRA